MLEAYSTSLAVAANDILTFNSTSIQTGIVATLAENKTDIFLNRPGIYRIDFNGYGASTAEGTIGVQLLANGTAIPRAISVAATGAGDNASIGFSILVTVNPAMVTTNAKLTAQYIGSAGTMELANIIVTKIA